MELMVEEVVLLCAQQRACLYDLFVAVRAIDHHRTNRQLETEWNMLSDGRRVRPEDREVDPSAAKAYILQHTVCRPWNEGRCRVVKCMWKHLCANCFSSDHVAGQCKKNVQPQ